MRRREDLKAHFQGIAEGRYVLRKVFRIVDEGAREAGLESLQHQALIQVFAAAEPLRVIELAERLDIPSTFASQLSIGLEEKGLLTRSRTRRDKRATFLAATLAGRDTLVAIDRVVTERVDRYVLSRTGAERAAVMGLLAFYVGRVPVEDLSGLIDLIAESARIQS